MVRIPLVYVDPSEPRICGALNNAAIVGDMKLMELFVEKGYVAEESKKGKVLFRRPSGIIWAVVMEYFWMI